MSTLDKESLEKERKSIMDDFDVKLEKMQKINRVLDDNVGDDLISKLMDVNNDLERTLSPNIKFVMLQMYFREGIRRFGEVGKKVLKPLTDDFTSGMIGYKDKRMGHLQEILKKAPETVQMSTNPQPQQEQPKKWYQSKKKEEI